MTVFAMSDHRRNADLIADCFELGYIRDDDIVLDPTYGTGRWWTKRRPQWLTGSDLKTGVDFRDLPGETGTYDVVAFDPPYKLNGTGGSHPSDEGYGVGGSYEAWQDKHKLIMRGIEECVRVLKPNGILLIKCQDQVCSGHVRWQSREFANYAEEIGCDQIDMLMLPGYRAQPAGRRQLHARRNYSTLLVFRKTP